ncbi:MAG TPA: Bcr/CflA family multidrug efflux MFS transporter [Paraburkholderia sp.]|jgi:DHA1 family bicyclomycin/chloramphenicol resistance-like MFS transporter|nr:Bcr/CflA family multidrug efflux MFS transporter [Paraburkholderia sp.]
MSHPIRRRPDRRLILLLGALAACGPLGTDIYLPSLPSIAASFGVSAAAAAATLTAFVAGFSLGMLLYGPVSDAYGRRPVLLAGIGLFTVASVACWLAGSIGQLTLMRFLQALGAGAASVLARTIARDAHEPGDAAKVLSMVALVTSVGPLLAPLIGGQLLLLGGWRTVFVALTLFGVFCGVAAYLRVPETWPPEKRASSAVLQSFAAYGRLLRDPVVWGHLLCGGMVFAAMFTYITATPFVYIQYFHVSPQHYGLFFGMNIVGIMAGNFLNTRFVGRFGALRLVSAASTVASIAALFVALVCVTGWGGLWSIVAGLFFVVGVVGILSANCATDLMYRYPRNAGAAAALFGATQLGLGAVAGFVVGRFPGISPVGMGWTIGACGVLGYVGRVLLVRWHGRPVPGHANAAAS